MPDPDLHQGFLSSLPERVFRLTGIHLSFLLKIGTVLLVAVAGISWTLLSTDAEHAGTASGIEGIDSKPQTAKSKHSDVSTLPSDFFEKLPVERLGILNSKIELGEELANSRGEYAERATDQLLFLYGARCNLEELEELDSEKTYRRLAQIRQAALSAGNESRVATADFLRALAAGKRLTRRSEQADFRFATDAVLNLDSKRLVDLGEAKELYLDAVNLHNSTADQDSTAIFLDILSDKLIGSPESGISSLGLRLKDYPKYFRFYTAIGKQPYSTRESKLQFYGELFENIEKAPPRAHLTYLVIFQLLDRLLNKSDVQTASFLVKRLSKAASVVSPAVKAEIDQSIENLEKRIAILGKTIDLSGSTFDGSQLQLPNGKPTTLVFWQPSDEKSANHIVLLAESEWLDPWESNVLVACSEPQTEDQLETTGKQLTRFTVLDNVTSLRLTTELGIDLVPYEVSLDKDNNIIRLNWALDQ